MKTKLFFPPPKKKIARLLLVIMICLPVCGSNAFAQTAESYVVLDNAAGTLTFKHDANKPAGAFSLNEDLTYPAWYAGDGDEDKKTILRKLSSILLLLMLAQRIVLFGFLNVKI